MESTGQISAAKATCPFCAERVSAEAKKCRHCGETLDIALRRAEEAMRTAEQRQSNVFMNAGGGGGGAASAAAVAAGSGNGQMLRPFKHWLHIIISIVTGGLWLPVYILMYVFRNKSYYY